MHTPANENSRIVLTSLNEPMFSILLGGKEGSEDVSKICTFCLGSPMESPMTTLLLDLQPGGPFEGLGLYMMYYI